MTNARSLMEVLRRTAPSLARRHPVATLILQTPTGQVFAAPYGTPLPLPGRPPSPAWVEVSLDPESETAS